MLKTVDRHIAPEIKDIESLNIVEPNQYTLSNGVSVFSFDVSDQDFIKIEINFDAGTIQSDKALVAGICNKLLTEGTKKHSSQEIATKIDSYGGFFETSLTNDVASIALYTLNKHLENTLPILAEVIQEPVFDANELNIHLAQKRNEFLVNSERVGYVARANFPAVIFGDNHPYGRVLKIEDFDQLNRDDIIDFHSRYYLKGNFRIFMSGKLAPNTISLLEKYFSSMLLNTNPQAEKSFVIASSNKMSHSIAKEQAVQNAIRIGKPIVNRAHADFNGLRILNTILGGYFGSRLMSNIREDKGYTYGIGSGLMSMQHASFFFITSEVKAEVSKLAIDEIIKEIEILQTQEVGAEELSLVKNYLQGNFQRSFDGPFALLDRFKEVYYSNLDYGYFNNYIELVKSIRSEDLLALANKYLNIEELYKLNVGKID
jgi:predicted Zn-dependent peptidase